MATRTKSLSWLLPLMSALFLLSGLTACGGGNDEVSENGGGIKVDPNIPTLSEISYELAPKAVIVPEATIKQITAVDTESHKFTLPSSASKPEVGQTLIINIPTTQLPDGLLAKVKSVTETDNGYQVTYEDAELKDAFKDIDVPEQYIPLGEYVQHVYDADGKEIKFETRANTRISGMKDFTIVIPEVSWKIAEGIELTPKMTIDLLLRYVMQFGDYELSYAAAKIDADVTIGADLAATIDETSFGEKRWRILQLQFAPVPVPAPPAVPILLLKPAIGIDIVAKAEGKITLEASISYERTMHASMIYQKGAGLSGNFNLDPEADDALKFSFGPKFEGGLGFGPSMLTWIGVYGEAMCLRGTLDMLAKQTISGKLDLTAFTGTTDDLLTPFNFDPATHSDWNESLKTALKNAKKWDFLKWESLNYNLSFAEKMDFQLIALGKSVSKLELPDVNVPILSIPIMPQFKIDEKDFFNIEDNDVTLLLHHTKKSVLDGLAEFFVEFKPVGSKSSTESIVKNFDFNDEKRNWLAAEVKGKDVTSTAKATINSEDDYNIIAYMKILGEEIPIFTMEFKNSDLSIDVQSIDFSADIEATASDGTKVTNVIEWGGFYIDRLGQGEIFKSKDLTVTPIDKKGAFQCVAVYDNSYDDTSGKTHKEKATISFTIDQPKNGSYGMTKNLEYTYEEEVYYQYYDFTVKIKESLSADNIPVSWTSESGKSVIWSGGAEEGVKMNNYYHSSVVDYTGETKQNLSFSSTDNFKLSLGINFAK